MCVCVYDGVIAREYKNREADCVFLGGSGHNQFLYFLSSLRLCLFLSLCVFFVGLAHSFLVLM